MQPKSSVPQFLLRSQPSSLFVGLLTGSLLLSTAFLHAASFTWTNLVSGNASGGWNTNTLWNPNGVPGTGGAVDTVDLSTLNITASSIVTLNTNVNVTSLTFGDTTTSSAAGWTLNVGSPAGVITNAGSPATTITVNALGTGMGVTNNAVMTGSPLIKAGAGVLVLGGANTFTNGLTINAGRVNISSEGNLGATPTTAATNITINGGVLSVTANNPTLSSNRRTALGPASGSGVGIIDVISGQTLTLPGNVVDNLGGIGSLVKASIGTLALRGNNTYSGTNLILSGTLNITNDFNLGVVPGSPTSGNVTISNSSLALAGNTTLNQNRGIALTGNATNDVASGVTAAYDGIIANGSAAGFLVKSSAGTLILSYANFADNAYTGGTLILAGTLQAGNGINTLGSASLGLGSGAITNNGTLIVNRPEQITYNGIIRGSGSLVVNSTNGTLTLGGANVYTGNTTVNAGTLQYGVATAIPSGAGFGNMAVNGTLAAPAVLDLNGNGVTLNSLSGNASATVVDNTFGSTTLTVGANNSPGSFPGTVNTSLGVTKIGTNTFTLSGANTYSGLTLVQTGKLVISTLNLNTGNFYVSNNATLGVTVAASPNQTALSSLTLGSGGGTALEFNNVINTTVAGPAPLNVSTLTLNGPVTINIPAGVFGTDQFPLIQFSSLAGSGGFVVGALPPGVATVQLVTNIGNSTIDILPITDLWTGNVNSNWDNRTVNWTQFGNPVNFTNGLQALFDDSSTRTNVNLFTNVFPGGVSFNNSSKNYTINSDNGSGINGNGFLFKNGSGVLTVLSSNNFSGPSYTRIGAGSLILANSNAIQGSTLDLNAADLGTITLSNLTTLNIGGFQGATAMGLTNTTGAAVALAVGGNGPDSTGYSGVLSGTNSTVTKVGTNQVWLQNLQAFTGATTVSNGVLVLGNNQNQGGFGGILPGSLFIASGGTVSNRYSGGTALGQFSGGGTNVFLGAGPNNSWTISGATNTGFTGTIEILVGRQAIGAGAFALGNPSMVYIGGIPNERGTITNGQLWANSPDIFNQPATINGLGSTVDGTPFGCIRLQGANWAGPITLAGDSRINAGGTVGFISGNISGTYQLEMGNNGQNLYLQPASGANTYGSTLLNGNGAIFAVNTGALSTGALSVNGTTVLNLFGNSFTVANLNGTGGTIQNGSFTSAATLTAGTDGSSTTFTGVLADPGLTFPALYPLSLTKVGGGTLTLSGINTFSGVTRIGAGSILLGNAQALQFSTVDMNGADAGSIDFGTQTTVPFGGLQGTRNLALVQGTGGSGAGVALTVGYPNPYSSPVYSGVLSGTGASVTKVGFSTLTLNGASTFDGGVLVYAGKLVVGNSSGSGTGSGSVSVNNGGTLTGTGAISGATTVGFGGVVAAGNSGSAGTLTLAGGLTLSSGALAYDLSAPANAGVINLAGGTATLTGGYVQPVNPNSVATGTYTLITGAGSIVGTPTAILPNGFTASFGGTASILTMTIGGAAAPGSIAWKAITGGTWDFTSSNWTNAAAAAFTVFTNGDNVLFTSNATYTVTLASPVYPASMTVSNSGGTMTLATSGGVIAGSTSLIKQGVGTLIMNGVSNLYTGGTIISGGDLRLGTGTAGQEVPLALGTGTITLTTNAGTAGRLWVQANGSTTVFNYPNNFVFNGGRFDAQDGYTHIASGPGATVSIGANGGTLGGYFGNKPIWIDGQLTGSGPLALIRGGGTDVNGGMNMFMNPANTYNGTISISGAAAAWFGSNSALQFANLIDNGTPTDNRSFRFDPLAVNPTIGSLAGSGNIILSAYSLAQNAALSIGVNLTAGSSGSNTVYNGIMSDLNASGAFSVKGSFVKAGNGTMILSGNNTYTGPTSISAGTLQLGNAGVAGSVLSGFITNNGALTFNRTDVFTNVAVISSTGSLTNAGSGTAVLGGVNTYSGNTTISAGTLRTAVAGAVPSGAGKGNVVANGTLDVNGFNTTINGLSGSGTVANASATSLTLTVGANDQTSSFGGAIKQGAGQITLAKTGSGTVTLAGANTYNGLTTVNQGKLVLGTASQGGGPITVNNSTALGVSVSGSQTMPVSTLALGSGGATTTEFSGVSSTATAPATATNLFVNGTVTINILSGSLSVNQYPLIKFVTRTGAGNFVIGTLPAGVTATVVTNVGAGTIALNVSAALPAIWNGAVNGNWDINTTTNWTFNGANAFYADGLSVQFDNDSTRTNIILTTTVSPGGVTVSGSQNYAFNGPGVIAGSGSLIKSGAGTLTLTNLANSYSGISTINGGTVVVNADNNLGAASPGNIFLSGATLSAAGSFTLSSSRTLSLGPGSGSGSSTVDVATNVTLTFGGLVANNGTSTSSLVKTSPGKLVLTGANTYTGGTTVNAGELDLTTAQQSGGSLVVSDGATLGVTASGGATLPASSLTLGGSGATTLIVAGVGSLTAPVTATNLTFNGVNTISVASLTAYKFGEYPIVQYTTLAGSGTIALGSLPLGVSGVLTNNASTKSIALIVTGVPTVVWTGASATWDIANTVSWQLGGTNVTYQDGESVLFDDSATGSVTPTYTVPVSPLSITVSNNSKNYTFNPFALAASISGSGGLTKLGTGSLTFTPQTNTFSGGTVIGGGSVALPIHLPVLVNTNLYELGTGTITITNNAFLQINGQGGGAQVNHQWLSNALTLNGGRIQGVDGGQHLTGPVAIGTLGASFQESYPNKYLLFDGVVSGSGPITIPAGFATVGTFGHAAVHFQNSANTYSGTLTLNNGALGITDPDGTAMANATVNLLNYAPANYANPIVWSYIANGVGVANSSGTITLGALAGIAPLSTDAGGTPTLSALILGNNNASAVYSGALSGSGAVVKMGTGTQTLSGANTYGNLTTVSNGTLFISTAHAGNGDFVVNDGKTLGVINNGGSQSAFLNNLTLGDTTGPTTLVITNVADPLTPVITAASAVTLNGNCTITIPTKDSVVAGNVYPLVKYGSLAGAGSFLLSVPGSVTATLTNDTSNLWIALNVTAVVTVNTTPTNITASVTGNTLHLTWPGDHLGWTLQTNAVSLSDPSQWFAYPGSATVTNVDITLNPSLTNVYFRLVYP